jgi:hypothetical protein
MKLRISGMVVGRNAPKSATTGRTSSRVTRKSDSNVTRYQKEFKSDEYPRADSTCNRRFGKTPVAKKLAVRNPFGALLSPVGTLSESGY